MNTPPEIDDLEQRGEIEPDELASLHVFRAELIKRNPKARAGFKEELSLRLNDQFQKQSQQLPLLPRNFRRMSYVAAVFILTTLGVGVAFAISLILQGYIEQDKGLRTVPGTHYNISAFNSNYRLILEWAHVDFNRLSVGFSISGFDCPIERYLFCDVGVRLLNASGMEATIISSQGQDETSTRTYLYNFEFVHDQPQADFVQFRLEVVPVGIVLGQSSSSSSAISDTISQHLSDTLALNFAVEMNSETRIMNLNLSTTSNNVSLTLRRLVISPSQTRVVLCFEPPIADYVWTAIPVLSVNGVAIGGGSGVRMISNVGEVSNEVCNEFTYDASLLDTRGDWQLEVKEMIGNAHHSEQERLQGQWIVEFEVP